MRLISVRQPVGVYYRARGRAQNVIGYGPWSVWSTPVIVLLTPGSPRLISAAAASPEGTEIDFRISWTHPLETGNGSSAWPLLAYEVRVTVQAANNPLGRVCNVKPAPVVTNGTRVTTVVISALTSKCSYEIAVRASNLVGWGPSAYYMLVVKVILQLCSIICTNALRPHVRLKTPMLCVF